MLGRLQHLPTAVIFKPETGPITPVLCLEERGGSLRMATLRCYISQVLGSYGDGGYCGLYKLWLEKIKSLKLPWSYTLTVGFEVQCVAC